MRRLTLALVATLLPALAPAGDFLGYEAPRIANGVFVPGGTAGAALVLDAAKKLSGVAPTDDRALIGSGTAWTATAVPNCDAAPCGLGYNTTTNAFSANTITAASVGAANTALSNLAGVAINAAPLPAAGGTLALGSDTLRWAAAYLGGNTLGTGGAATSTPPLSITQTWNTTSALTALLVNVTNTASDAASRLMSLGTGGGSYVETFGVAPTGGVYLGTTALGGAITTRLDKTVGSDVYLQISSDEDVDTADYMLYVGDTGNAQLLKLSGHGLLTVANGITATTNFQAGATYGYTWNNRGGVYSTADATFQLKDNAGTAPGSLVQARPVIAVDAADADDSYTLTVLQSGSLVTNTGDNDGLAVILPNDPTVGASYSVQTTAAQTITITPSAGETLYLGADQCIASITLGGIGSTVDIKAAVGGAGGVWIGDGNGATCND